MLFNRFYYQLKPLVPSPLRIGLRRFLARRTRRLHSATWPIDPKSATPPEGWPGWPDGKQFALVLTHDVEGPKGLNRVHELMQLEQELGFRSSFNLIPEGSYKVSREFRNSITSRGFEVGVHDLRHDGKLYWSRDVFRNDARTINSYLRDWKAVGFRSGFMHHRLDWLHDLEIEYDMSTFDTDPFEPQPDAVHTIFPFWVQNPQCGGQRSEVGGNGDVQRSTFNRQRSTRGGYVELPYTLPQDSTIFTVLRERDIKIWKEKLDWIAERNGMALVNVHPDYISFDGATLQTECPPRYYAELLQYAKSRYGKTCWNPLPCEVADLCLATRPRHTNRPRKSVCMLAYSFYESDNRVMRYAETLARRGDRVEVVALDDGRNRSKQESLAGVTVHRIQKRLSKGSITRAGYFFPLLRFTTHASWFLARRHIREPYDLVHVHNVPDFLVFAAWFPKLFGARVILDIHDIVPEFYASKFNVGTEDRIVRLLQKLEKLCARFADHVIVSNHLWQQKLVRRSVGEQKCSVFLNHIDPEIFYRRSHTRNDRKKIILFPGGLQWHQGLDIAIRAFASVHDQLPDAEFHIYGEGNAKPDLVRLVSELGVESKVHFFDPVSIRQMPELISNADLGVVPKRANSFGDEAFSTKIMEFMSQGVPVVVSRTKIDSFYFNDKVVRFFDSGNEQQLARAIVDTLRDSKLYWMLAENGTRFVQSHTWDTKKADYLALVDRLKRRNGEVSALSVCG